MALTPLATNAKLQEVTISVDDAYTNVYYSTKFSVIDGFTVRTRRHNKSYGFSAPYGEAEINTMIAYVNTEAVGEEP